MRLRLLALAGLAALTALAVATSGAGGAVGTQQGCKVRNNFLAIIDDSGSMAGTDPNRLRVQGINVMTSLDTNANKTLAAEEFGSNAAPLFPPGPMGPNQAAIANLLSQKINADNGGTNYNAAFSTAKSFGVNTSSVHSSATTGNAPRDAWIFLTDGGHNEGVYQNGHAGGPVTEVVGLGPSIFGIDETRLKQIASDNGGTYQKATDAAGIQEAFVNITADLNCQPRPKKFVDTFNGKVGQVKRHSFRVRKNDRSEQITATWTNPNGDKFDITRIRLVNRQGDTIAVPARKRKRRKLRIRKKRGATFVTVKVGKLKRGRLKFRIKAKKLANPGVPVQVTTQVSRTKKKKR